MISIGSDLFADFGTNGIWKYTNGTWVRVSVADVVRMGILDGKLLASFGRHGLYRYDGSWSKLSESEVEGMISIGSDLYADFGSKGIWKYADGNYPVFVISCFWYQCGCRNYIRFVPGLPSRQYGPDRITASRIVTYLFLTRAFTCE